jgi:antitoxin component YwqK of YwqJK toxin-antitoxin module
MINYLRSSLAAACALFALLSNAQTVPLEKISIYPDAEKHLFSCDTNVVFYYCGNPDWIIWNDPSGCDTLRGTGYYNGALYTGLAVYKIGELTKAKVLFEKGLPANIQIYYNNGKLQFDGHYKLGIKHGKYAYYTQDGQVYELFNYADGLKTGHSEQRRDLIDYGDSESYFLDTCWYIKNNKHGKCVSLRYDHEHYQARNGSVYATSHYKHGLKHGESAVWYINGQKKEQWEYQDGKVTGIYTCWEPSGKVFHQTMFINGSGTVKQRYQEGGWIKTTEYKDGLPVEIIPSEEPEIIEEVIGE